MALSHGAGSLAPTEASVLRGGGAPRATEGLSSWSGPSVSDVERSSWLCAATARLWPLILGVGTVCPLAAAAEEYAASVVVVVAEAVAELDERVDGLGGLVRFAAGAVVGEDLVTLTIDRAFS